MTYMQYDRKEFIKWKHRVWLRLPELVTKFYSQRKNRYSKDSERCLGRVISDINNPHYAFLDFEKCKPTDDQNYLAASILLRIDVEGIFKEVYGKVA